MTFISKSHPKYKRLRRLANRLENAETQLEKEQRRVSLAGQLGRNCVDHTAELRARVHNLDVELKAELDEV